jgi:hypothetical protein
MSEILSSALLTQVSMKRIVIALAALIIVAYLTGEFPIFTTTYSPDDLGNLFDQT